MNNLTTDVDGICNLDCEFCYADLDGSEQELAKVIADIKAGTTKKEEFDIIEIGGGEPFLYRSLLDLLIEIEELGKKAHVSTNATFIPKGLLDLEEKVRNNTMMQTSLHASNSKLYKEITGEDFFYKVIDNIIKIKDKYQTVISAAIYEKNFSDVKNIITLSYDLGLPIRINLVAAAGKGKDVKLLEPKQVHQLRSIVLNEKRNNQNMIDSPLLHQNTCYAVAEAYGIEKAGPCPIDTESKIYVNPRGEKFACEFFKKQLEEKKWHL